MRVQQVFAAPRMVRRASPIVRSYLDRVSHYDVHNRVFYIFYIGTYHNKPIYCYGETNDIELQEFTMKRTLPFYQPVVHIPIDTNVATKNMFDTMVQPFRITIPISECGEWDAFTTNDAFDIRAVVDYVQHIYHMYADADAE